MGDNAVLQDSSTSHSSSNRGTTARDGGAETQQMQITIDSQSFVNLGQLMGSRVSVSTAVGGPPSSVGGAGNNNNALGTSFLSDGSHDSEGLRDFDQIFHPAGSTASTWSGHELGPHEEDAMGDADSDGDNDVHEDDDDEDVVDDDDDDVVDDDDSVLPALPPRSPAPASPTGSALSSSPSNSSSSGRPFKSSLAGFGDDLTTASSAGGSAIAVAGSIDDDFPDIQGEVIGALRLDAIAGGDASCQRKTVTGITTPGNHHLHDDGRDSKKDINNGSKQPSSSSSAREAGMLPGDAGSVAASPTSINRESWLHVPLEGSETRLDCNSSSNSSSGSVADDSANDGPAEAKTKNKEQALRNQEHTTAARAGARRAVAALGECGDCLACGVEKAVALATPPLQHLSRLVKLQVEAGLEACAKGQQAAVKAVDNVPQAPVRMWLSRIAGSLVFGAILGGTAAYYALPRFVMASVSTCAGTDATSPWWNTPAGSNGESSQGGAEQSFGERLNKALFAARAGESVAQQSLLEEVRTILAATGKSGGISAEQILRQFNAKRFAEASKAWSAAEGIAGSDPLDPLFFAPPSTPIYTSAAPSSASQKNHYSGSHKSAADCAAGGGGGAFCSADGVGAGSGVGGGGIGGGGGGGGEGTAPRAYRQTRGGGSSGEGGTSAGRQNYRRSCGGGGWVC